MSGRGISSKPGMVGKSGINNGTISCCMSLSQVGQFNLYSGFLHCGQSCKFERQEKQPKYRPQFLKIAQNLAWFQNKPCLIRILSFFIVL